MNGIVVRPARPGDLDALVRLARDHADFEGGVPSDVVTCGSALSDRLRTALFATTPALHAWVATVDDECVGYATASPVFSTWRGCEFLHMDCLYLDEQARGDGVGGVLLNSLIEHARRLGIDRLEWQTPRWNERAARFYRRLGASVEEKCRFAVSVT